MIRFDTYVKFSIEGLLAAFDDEFAGASPVRRVIMEEERARLLADYDTFVDIATALPRFDSKLFDRVFPRRNKKGELFLRVKPQNSAEAIAFLDLLEAYPLAHREGDRVVSPWSAQSETHRIFPYTIIVQMKPHLFCRLVWCYEHRNGEFIYVRLQLPDELLADAVDPDSGVLRDGMFISGLSPYVYAQTNAHGRRLGLHFPKAYTPIGDGRFRLLGWRDIPLLRDAERKKNEPNKAPEPTTMAVTIRAPSSTARASHGRGSS